MGIRARSRRGLPAGPEEDEARPDPGEEEDHEPGGERDDGRAARRGAGGGSGGPVSYTPLTPPQSDLV